MFKSPRPFPLVTALTITLIACLISLCACGGSVHPQTPGPGVTATGSPAPAPGNTSSPSTAPSGPPPAFTFTDIDDMSGWTSCANTMAGHECAGGQGFAPTSLMQHASQPSLDGSSGHFWLGGNHPYSNVMWWRQLQSSEPKATKYRYEFNVYMTHPDLPEALEFDVNQSQKGIRWIFGTECSFRDTHHWDVWDATAHWVPTNVPCKPFAPNTWNHVAWTFERSGDQVHYISVEVNGVVSNVDMYMRADKSWPWDGSLNVAFQMDGNINQDDFDVWLDKVSLTGW